MRPVKQAAVVSTHAWIHFAPLALAGLAMITRFSRDAFLFVSAAMITYSYLREPTVQLGQYWRRRTMSVVVPYVCWTLIYFAYVCSGWGFGAPAMAKAPVPFETRLHQLAVLMLVGYHQLYFLLILMQFYVVFPLLLAWLRRNERFLGRIMLGALALQVALGVLETSGLSWFPVRPYWASRICVFYAIYLIGGMVVALRLDDVHAWLLARKRELYVATIASLGLILVLWTFERHGRLPTMLHTGAKEFSIASIPYNSCVIACLYILGVFLVDPKRGLRTKAIVQSGSDNAYGVYLSQALWMPLLVLLFKGQGALAFVPWPVAVVGAVAITYALGVVFSALVARTPLAKPVVGRSRATWSTLLPRRRLTPANLHEDTGDGPMDVAVE
jgi:peptidoglycan/LPS O-acetylase OafA/YrhL